ncbi:ParB/Srx family N-terminal domain-containing protein, partial [Belnapia rosea]|uniref:ParB/Srx family N-terminal domain-containing protein n=1 Tax=Belnapia rosea TaxID=938405 RepID=UPI000888D594
MVYTSPNQAQPIRLIQTEAAHNLTVEYRPLSSLRLDPRNPRVHSPRQIRQIGRSIEAFGFNVPVLVDGEGRVVAGHGRVLACQHLGWTEVPTIRLDHLGPEQARAFMVADNRLTETSSWDERLLGETLRDLAELELDFSLEATGFEMGEIDLKIEGLATESEGKPDPADTILPPPTGPAITRPGDLWLLGRHRLLCGSALEEASYAALIPSLRERDSLGIP